VFLCSQGLEAQGQGLKSQAKYLGPKAKPNYLSAKAKDLGPKAKGKDSRCQRQVLIKGLFTSFLTFTLCECFCVRILIPVLTAFCLFMNKWIYYCYYWQIDSSQRRILNTQHDNYHKIIHAHCSWSQQSAEDGTLHKHQGLEHFVRHFRMMLADDKPLLQRTLLTGAEVTGTARILSNKYSRGTNSIWIQMSASFVSLSYDIELMVSM